MVKGRGALVARETLAYRPWTVAHRPPEASESNGIDDPEIAPHLRDDVLDQGQMVPVQLVRDVVQADRDRAARAPPPPNEYEPYKRQQGVAVGRCFVHRQTILAGRGNDLPANLQRVVLIPQSASELERRDARQRRIVILLQRPANVYRGRARLTMSAVSWKSAWDSMPSSTAVGANELDVSDRRFRPLLPSPSSVFFVQSGRLAAAEPFDELLVALLELFMRPSRRRKM